MVYNYFYKYLLSIINSQLLLMSGKMYSIIKKDGLEQAQDSRMFAAVMEIK